MFLYDNISAANQPQRRTEVVTIGRLAPDFIELSTQGTFKLSDYRGKWLINIILLPISVWWCVHFRSY